MPQHFIHQWNAESIANQELPENKPQEALDHCAAESYSTVEPSDVLWIVSMKGGRIWLRYRFLVEELATQEQADQRFGMRMWEARYHLYGRGSPLLEHEITPLAPMLSFDSKSRPRLNVAADGTVSNQAFRVARRLNASCVPLLEKELASAMSAAGV